MEMLFYMLLEIAVILCFVLFWQLTRDSNLKKLEANQRANELLRSVLTSDRCEQLTRNGYLDIKSPRDAGCIYRVPRAHGLVKVIEHGIHKANLCLQPKDAVPDADIVVIHKLMIEADEETYVQTAHTFAPMNNETWLDRGIW
jgi:hypothetical protein